MEPRSDGAPGSRPPSRVGARTSRRRWQYRGTGSFERMCKAIVGNSGMGFFAMRYDGTIVFCTQPMADLVGRVVSECMGKNVIDWLNPEDYGRAWDLMSLSTTEGPPPGTSRFMVAHSDGSWVPLEITGATVSDGSEQLLVVFCRNGAPRLAIEEVMALLLSGMDLPDVLTQVCNVVEWSGYGTHVAIAWYDDGIFQQVSTGVPAIIGGSDDDFGSGDGQPGDGQAGDGQPGDGQPGNGQPGDGQQGATLWARCRRDHSPVVATADDLDPGRRAAAADLGVAEAWIVPVVWDEQRPPATITIWTVGGGRSPQVHAYGMEVARNMVELILRWTDQQRGLERAAHLDALTGIANRRVFFDSLAAANAGGAVLYCDLDNFKPVNDALGHSAGDEVLRAVAQRMAHCVRQSDLVARLGGDEFAVICAGADEAEAAEVAVRIEKALESPIVIEGSSVTVGVSIGIAQSDEALTEALVDAADGALAEAKAAGRATYRVAHKANETL